MLDREAESAACGAMLKPATAVAREPRSATESFILVLVRYVVQEYGSLIVLSIIMICGILMKLELSSLGSIIHKIHGDVSFFFRLCRSNRR